MVFLILILSFFFSSLEAGCDPVPVSIEEVTEEMIEAFWSADLSDCLIIFPEGALLPLHFFVKGNYFRLTLPEESQLTLEIIKTFYLKINYGDIQLSQDLIHWHGLYESLYLFLIPGLKIGEEGLEILIDGELSLRLK